LFRLRQCPVPAVIDDSGELLSNLQSLFSNLQLQEEPK
jgi:hypothetical protein